MAVEEAIDSAKVEAFVGKVFGDLAGVTNTAMASIGDQLGLFRTLAEQGAATSTALAERTGTNERYIREWLAAMASADYLTYDATTATFAIPAEHVPALADEGGSTFLGGVQQQFMGLLMTLDTVADAFRNGGGVANSEFDAKTWDGLARLTGSWVKNQLVQTWIPLMPRVQERLNAGAELADVGTGYGQAIIRMAQEFPKSRFVGLDINERSISRARELAEEAGVSDRVRFEQRDAANGLPGQYDLITTFDVIHDTVNPRATLKAIRQALKPGGIYVCQDMNCSEHLEENVGTLGAALYGVSVLFCMTVSLAAGGEGLGTYGLPETKLRQLSAEVGFGEVRRVPFEDPFSAIYEIDSSVGGI